VSISDQLEGEEEIESILDREEGRDPIMNFPCILEITLKSAHRGNDRYEFGREKREPSWGLRQKEKESERNKQQLGIKWKEGKTNGPRARERGERSLRQKDYLSLSV